MSDSRLHPTDNSFKENDDSQTDAANPVDKSEDQPQLQKTSDEAQREEERQLETGEENPT